MKNIFNVVEAATGRNKADLVIKNIKYLNVFTSEFELSNVAVKNGYFVGTGDYQGENEIDCTGMYMVPGFIDGHMHLESSAVLPTEYAKAVLPHGTTAIVTDPHEITNVCGENGVKFMMDSCESTILDVFFMLPSCVPASPFDENGAEFSVDGIKKFIDDDRVLGLAEVMNYPGVIYGDTELYNKMDVVNKAGKLFDGHAPGLAGKNLNGYNAAGIYTDHECSSLSEAVEKMRNGEWIMVREGTASRNLNALIEMFNDKYFRRCLLVTDDKHPGDIIRDGHIDHIIRKAIKLGAKPENAYCMASLHAAQCFGLKNRGAIAPGYIADFMILDNIESVDIKHIYKCGNLITESDIENIKSEVDEGLRESVKDTVRLKDMSVSDFEFDGKNYKVMGLIPGDLLTTDEGYADSVDIANDIVKLCVVERHKATGHIGKCFMKGYGIKTGAIATTVAHDSHNIVVSGTNSSDMLIAVTHLKEIGGGMVVVKDGEILGDLALPIAGLMSELDVYETRDSMERLKDAARELGVNDGVDPFMTLSFTSLPVIPSIKLTSKGVVDVDKFELI